MAEKLSPCSALRLSASSSRCECAQETDRQRWVCLERTLWTRRTFSFR